MRLYSVIVVCLVVIVVRLIIIVICLIVDVPLLCYFRLEKSRKRTRVIEGNADVEYIFHCCSCSYVNIIDYLSVLI